MEFVSLCNSAGVVVFFGACNEDLALFKRRYSWAIATTVNRRPNFGVTVTSCDIIVIVEFTF